MNVKIWHAVEIEISPEAEEAITFAINDLDSLGTEINDLNKTKSDALTVVGYFEEKPGDLTLENALRESLRIYDLAESAIKKIEWREVENQDWLATWKTYWRPTETEKFIVAPAWETIGNRGKIIIRIEPGMAFGTGTHETTRLCLKAIERNYRREMSFLDVGTGTGILAVGAAKIQGKSKKEKGKILACDIDSDSIKIAIENAEVNAVTDLIDFYAGSISEETPEFDFVCANLTADVIVPLLPLLIGRSKRFLVLSGILTEQRDVIVSELKKLQIVDFEVETDGEWISISVGGTQ